MTYSDTIKGGLRLVYKNWQLVLIQFGMMMVSCMGFFLFVGLPLAVAFIMFGLDLTELTKFKDLIGTMREPSELISRYMGLLIVFLASVLVYLLIIMTIGLFVFGGSAGMIGRIIKDNSEKFNMRTFMAEGKRLFWPLVWFSTIISIVFLLVAFVLGLFGGGIAAIISIAKEQGATLAIFLGIFFSLLLFCVGIVLVVFTIALTLYGVAYIVFKGLGPLKAAKETFKYLYRHPDALWLYCIAFVGYFVVSFMVILVGTPFSLIPFVGTIISVPYHLFSYAVQSYLGLVIIALTFIYFFSTEVAPFETSPTATGEGSTQVPDISLSEASGQETPPPQKENQG